MFRDLPLKSTYSTYEDDIGKDFYSPVLRESVSYDRATAYFSSKALACYAKGLEEFVHKGHRCRLIVSSELSREDYEQIKNGYELRESVETNLLQRLRECLSLEEEKGISNLAYLVSIGSLDIKIAFTAEGIFHDKFGVMKDETGAYICFRGSNNETYSGFNQNYESFDITCSWQTSSFDFSKISKSIDVFEKLWENKTDNVMVCDVSKVVYDEITSHNKGKLIVDEAYLEDDCLLLDYDSCLRLEIKTEPSLLLGNSVYKLRLKRYVDLEKSANDTIIFKSNLTYPVFKKIIRILTEDAVKRDYKFLTTKRLIDYINQRELYIEKRASVGLSIRRKDPVVISAYEEYKAVVDNSFIRGLRENQMWDSFYMCTMKKSSNFSVPGSGKTASVYGVFSFLKSKGLVNRILMVGPKSSFGSWIDEFTSCFGDKLELRIFNMQQFSGSSLQEKKQALSYDTGNKNLLLFNYEGLGSCLKEIKALVNDRTLLVFDEIHKVKAINGSRARDALAIASDSHYTIALTGTPIPNTYTDIRNLLDILYQDEYEEFFGFSLQQLSNPTEEDISQINEKLQPFFCRTTKQQLQVPEINPDLVITVPATINENELFNILTLKYAKNKFALIVRLLQMESDPKMLLKTLDLSEFADLLDTTGEIEQFDFVDYSSDFISLVNSIRKTQKFEQCIRTADILFQAKKPTIIWCIFIDTIKNIQSEIEKLGASVGCIHGAISMEERNTILEAFRIGELDFLITNPHTLAESVSLHSMCHDAIYFEYSYNLVHLLQSKDRIHRLGLPAGQYTQYYFLQQTFTTKDNVEFSLDERILNRLMEKEKVMLDAIDNNILESGCTPEEDLDLIFSGLGLGKL